MLFVGIDGGKSNVFTIDGALVKRTYNTSGPSAMYSACFSSQYRTVIIPQRQGSLFAFSLDTQQPVRKSFLPETLSACTVSACGNYLIGGGESSGSLYQWSLATGELLRIIKSHLRRVLCIAVSPCGSYVATASEDSTCQIWSASRLVSQSVKHAVPHVVIAAHTLAVRTCAFLHASCPIVVTGSNDRTARFFDALTGVQMRCVRFDAPVTLVQPFPDDSGVLVGCSGGDLAFIHLYDQMDRLGVAQHFEGGRFVENGRKEDDDEEMDQGVRVCRRRKFVDGHDGDVCFANRHPTEPDHLIVGSTNGAVLTWSVSSAKVVAQTLPTQKKVILSMCYIPSCTFDVTLPSAAAAAAGGGCRTTKASTLFPNLSKYPVDLQVNGFTVVTTTTVSKNTNSFEPDGKSNPANEKEEATHPTTEKDVTEYESIAAVEKEGVNEDEGEEGQQEERDPALVAKLAQLETVRNTTNELKRLRDQLQRRAAKLDSAKKAKVE